MTNGGATPVRIEDVASYPGPSPQFPTYGAIAGEIAPGETAEISFAFRPGKPGPQTALYQVISVERADTMIAAPNADGYFVCSSQNEILLAELREVARNAPDKLRRTILVGPAFDFVYGWGRSKEGTVADSMEKYGMGGWIAPDALTSWGHVGSSPGRRR